MKQIITLTESELKRAVKKSIKKVLDKPKRGWGDIGDHSTPERGYYYCEETDYSSGRIHRWIGDENDAKICRTCSEGGAYGPFNSRSDAVNFMKHFDKDYRERNEKIYGKSNKDEDKIYGSYDKLDESKIIRLTESQFHGIVARTVRMVLAEGMGTDTSAENRLFRALLENPGCISACYCSTDGNEEACASFEIETNDGWHFLCDDLLCKIELESHTVDEPQTWEHPGAYSDPEGYLYNFRVNPKSPIVYTRPGSNEERVIPVTDTLNKKLDNIISENYEKLVDQRSVIDALKAYDEEWYEGLEIYNDIGREEYEEARRESRR